jgi:hypothetical protein
MDRGDQRFGIARKRESGIVKTRRKYNESQMKMSFRIKAGSETEVTDYSYGGSVDGTEDQEEDMKR